jgi:putative inorganic carbon (HCO3(-)) transporter
MSWPVKIIRFSFHLVFFLVPLIFLPNTSELFEFNKMIVTYILTSVIVTAWAIHTIFEKRYTFRRTALDWPIIIFLASQFISLVFSVNVRSSWLGYYSRFNGGLASLLCYSILYWAFVTFMDRKSALKVISTGLWTAAIISFYGVLEHFGIDATMWVQDVQNRVFSTLGQPNWLAAYLIALLPLSLSLGLSARNMTKKITYVSLSLLLLVTILFTKSQSGIAVTLITLFLYLILFLYQKRQVRLIIAGLVLFFLLVTLSFKYITHGLRSLSYMFSFQNITAQAMHDNSARPGGTSSILIRRIVWQGGFDIWLSSAKNFFIGTGPETFAMVYYQHRPIAHNYTSEWELLYNKAHNEFVNYLATTGILGLGSYLVLLGSMLFLLTKYEFPGHPTPAGFGNQNPKHLKNPDLKNYLEFKNSYLGIALLAGWISIPVTNFWGFSVVIVQILMFLLPAMVIALNTDPAPPQKPSPLSLSSGQIGLFLLILCSVSCLLFAIIKYWLADTKYASGQQGLRAFSLTQEPDYILSSYQSLHQAYELNSRDPAISSDLAVVTAYLSVMSAQSDATTSSQLAQTAMDLSQKSINENPLHPNFYKSRARMAIILSLLDPKYLGIALQTLQQAEKISPTDPRIPYNMGVVAQYQGNLELAKKYFRTALDLKSDFADPAAQLDHIASVSGQMPN